MSSPTSLCILFVFILFYLSMQDTQNLTEYQWTFEWVTFERHVVLCSPEMSRSCPALPSRAVVLWELFKTMHGQDKSGPWSTMRAPHCSCNALWQHFWWDDDSVIEWHFQATIPVPTCLFPLLLAEIMFGRAHPFCSLRSNGPIKIHDFCNFNLFVSFHERAVRQSDGRNLQKCTGMKHL